MWYSSSIRKFATVVRGLIGNYPVISHRQGSDQRKRLELCDVSSRYQVVSAVLHFLGTNCITRETIFSILIWQKRIPTKAVIDRY